MKTFLAGLFILLSFNISAQLPYTSEDYSYQTISNIVYGTATNYAGLTDTLLLDIYKPSGDNNCNRPLLVLIHGGAWIAGSKADPNIVAIAQKMAARGYVVAAINYRLGTHKTNNYTMYWACNNQMSQPCGYIADSSEVIRAIYRGMQDAKGAIRFMKSRHLIDSTDINNTYVAGESAGAFIALSAAFTDQLSEKPADAGAIPNAVNPDTDLISCLLAGYSLQRPDLGSIDGNLNTGTYNASVKGVGSFYGGLPDLSILAQNNDTPSVYLFHQGSDVVVHWQYGVLLGRTSWECYASAGNICQPYNFYPSTHGGEAIRQYLVSQNFQATTFTADIISNYSYGNDCFANGHSIDSPTLRTQNMADLFALKIAQSGNVPTSNCQTGIAEQEADFSLYPNPLNGLNFKITTEGRIQRVIVQDLQGRIIHEEQPERTNPLINFRKKPSPGVYFVSIWSYSDTSSPHKNTHSITKRLIIK